MFTNWSEASLLGYRIPTTVWTDVLVPSFSPFSRAKSLCHSVYSTSGCDVSQIPPSDVRIHSNLHPPLHLAGTRYCGVHRSGTCLKSPEMVNEYQRGSSEPEVQQYLSPNSMGLLQIMATFDSTVREKINLM